MDLSCTRIEVDGACYPTTGRSFRNWTCPRRLSLEYSTMSHNAYGQIHLVMHDE